MKELSKEARDERNRYAREWRSRNKDKVAEAARKYWERRAAESQKQKEVSTHA